MLSCARTRRPSSAPRPPPLLAQCRRGARERTRCPVGRRARRAITRARASTRAPSCASSVVHSSVSSVSCLAPLPPPLTCTSAPISFLMPRLMHPILSYLKPMLLCSAAIRSIICSRHRSPHCSTSNPNVLSLWVCCSCTLAIRQLCPLQVTSYTYSTDTHGLLYRVSLPLSRTLCLLPMRFDTDHRLLILPPIVSLIFINLIFTIGSTI